MAKRDPKTGEVYIEQPGGGWSKIPGAQYDAEQMGSGEAFGQGFGRTIEQVTGGIMDAAYGLMGGGEKSGITGESMRETLGKVQQDYASEFAPVQEAHGLATGLGQAAPYLLTAPMGGASIGGQAALAGGMGLLGTSGDVGERLMAGGTGAALGAAGAGLGNMAGRVYGMAKNAYRPGVAGQFAAAGGRVTPGQALDSSGLQRAEALMQSAGVFDAKQAANQTLIQSQAGKAIGQADGAIDLTPTGLGNSADDIGARINQSLEGIDDIGIDNAMIEKLQKVKGDSPYIDFPDPDSTMSGEAYQQIRSQMAGVARSEASSATKTPGKLEYVQSIIDDLDQKFIGAAGKDAGEQLGAAREQWRNLLAMERGQAITPDGMVNPKSLNNALNQTWKKTYRRGKDSRVRPETRELFQGARDQSSRGLTSVVGDSGTATRLGAGLGVPLLAGVGAGGYSGDAGTGIMAALGAYGLMRGYGSMGNIMARQTAPHAAGGGRALLQGLMAQQ